MYKTAENHTTLPLPSRHSLGLPSMFAKHLFSTYTNLHFSIGLGQN